jgi:hypothetical protein
MLTVSLSHVAEPASAFIATEFSLDVHPRHWQSGETGAERDDGLYGTFTKGSSAENGCAIVILQRTSNNLRRRSRTAINPKASLRRMAGPLRQDDGAEIARSRRAQ